MHPVNGNLQIWNSLTELRCSPHPRHRKQSSPSSTPNATTHDENASLFLYRSARTGSSVAPFRQLFVLTEEEVERIDTFVPPPLPELPDFEQALHRARTLAQDEATDRAWSILEAALPQWHSDSPYRIAPVVLLANPTLRDLVTPERVRTIVTTPRRNNRS